MPTEKPRVTILIPQEMLDAINNYRFQGKFKNLTQAILSLIEIGLAEIETSGYSKIDIATAQETRHFEEFQALDPQERLIISVITKALLARDSVDKETIGKWAIEELSTSQASASDLEGR